MAIVVHRYEAPDRFVAGTVGSPGERTFFLQAREGNRITSVACEKQQVSVLAEHLERVLEEVVRRTGGRVEVPPPRDVPDDNQPLDAPITEEFRVGTMTIAWDADDDKIVIEMFSSTDAEVSGLDLTEADPEVEAEMVQAVEEERAEEVFVVRITPRTARDFVARANAVVSAGRPSCPFCLQPMDAEGHVCPRANGYRRPLF
ncbi:DUF3090 domain-containing protein [Desertihabitans brevis]|uniref:DUF3090 domain-containing protein n=1 Tax=Desertihabitans brevis TaxID=2268447 RepID=A0A367YQP2_9ACTN|nr:DUF3090 domain-containing protein [Desertihabitans brevis]RCK68203.1 DUF3090 domain-containing protein [Desertihabitans brevis]